MGIFYKTILVKDFTEGNLDEILENKDRYIVLSTMNQIIDMHEKEIGYVLKKELLKYFPDKIKDEDMRENSRLIEFMSTTYDIKSEPYMTVNLMII